MAVNGHRHAGSVSQNHKAQLASAYNELGKELSSQKIRVVGNYTLGKVIGEGTYGKVRLGVHRLTGSRVAIKQIPKAMSAALTREIHHHRQLHHPHVTQLFEVIATESNIWLVTELCSGGELFDYLAEKGRLGEDETRIIFGQLCLAVAYVHEKGIVHRDLKLENVLLDERCRVKLGDFGFTREFDRGSLLETFCGTTGYASPEMLMAKKYLGPEVDIWSLGVILYTLLTGTLPFDDDDEAIMKQKVIRGVYEDPEWLSEEARDLIRQILQTDPTMRPAIAQILAHPWFALHQGIATHAAAAQSTASLGSEPPSPSPLRPVSPATNAQPPSASSGASDSTFHSASSEFFTSGPTTPDDVFASGAEPEHLGAHRNASVGTLKNVVQSLEHAITGRPQPETVPEEDVPSALPDSETPARPTLSRTTTNSSAKIPPAYPTRTPARTKRRSVSSTLSELERASSPAYDKSPGSAIPQDFSSLLNTPAPLIFSTPLERELLNSLSMLGFDTGQIVHSVLTDACDATGALWWTLKRRAEKKALEEECADGAAERAEHEDVKEDAHRNGGEKERAKSPTSTSTMRSVPATLTQTQTHSAPELLFIPPTPTAPSTHRPSTPPRAKSPNNPLLSPSPSIPEIAQKSHPSTPGGSLKDKDKDGGSKGRKARSGSVSIMQRATTALEAAGLVRKKSAEVIKEEKEREKEREREKNAEKRGEEPRASHGSGSSKLSKTPPLRGTKEIASPTTPPRSTDSLHHPQSQTGSPWVVTGSSRKSPPPTTTHSPADTLGALPNISGKVGGGHRNRASLLSAFRMWFKEDPKGKRKEDAGLPQGAHAYKQSVSSPGASPVQARARGTVKRRPSGTHGKVAGASARKGAHRSKRASMSSRRSSSVNSRRSSITSAQYVLDSPVYSPEPVTSVSRQRSDPSRRSIGSRTPNSELEDYVSRPSSVHSFTNQRHRKSPSASSASSMHLARGASPLPKYHRRAGSGSSTRVLRQVQPVQPAAHLRSNSASSAHSLTSSRQGSLYEADTDARRTSSPHKAARRAAEEPARRAHSAASFVAHKRQTPFASAGAGGYLGSFGRSSWKKSWGLEPPGWQTRAAHPAVEVLAVFPTPDAPAGLRDVFAGRQAAGMGDESDWVDEDEDAPVYAGGLGQLYTAAGGAAYPQPLDSPVAPSPRAGAGRGAGGKRVGGGGLAVGTAPGRSARKGGRSPGERSSPLPGESFEPAESRAGRRSLPPGRSGPAFKHPIQEEDEGEE
ncbi:Pkinase-domain-containing protein [Obba rivulosa]|uniref:Pkinase-domain-containing protein n=1 Tax=Obba rivulosa TaxID=1052685 RepID=A0A8E2AW07_9APHY|nr:Pkinase-domain-containing protein [Obba rivulosa]